MGSPAFSCHKTRPSQLGHPNTRPNQRDRGTGLAAHGAGGFSVKLTLQWSEMAAVERDVSFQRFGSFWNEHFGAYILPLGWSWMMTLEESYRYEQWCSDHWHSPKNALFFLVWRMRMCGENPPKKRENRSSFGPHKHWLEFRGQNDWEMNRRFLWGWFTLPKGINSIFWPMLLLSTPKFQSIGCHPKRWKHAKHVGFFVDLKGGEIFAYAAYHMPIPCFTSSLSHLNSPLCCHSLQWTMVFSLHILFGLGHYRLQHFASQLLKWLTKPFLKPTHELPKGFMGLLDFPSFI